MAEIRLPAWRDVILNFTLMLAMNLAYEATHRLRALGRPVLGLLEDSLGIATLIALGMYFLAGSEEGPAQGRGSSVNRSSFTGAMTSMPAQRSTARRM
jgi:hypothetical protein